MNLVSDLLTCAGPTLARLSGIEPTAPTPLMLHALLLISRSGLVTADRVLLSGRLDLNQRPPAPKAGALPT